ncbi:nucleoside hydrolase [Cohnella lubricantis]|uniref:Nucleoside hydrolase n=1 Tax=Cohnella lubricantis TaxID=2163172 RepID=A0A841TB64_9BACL|nr:nucleoside hydrolase [Cohnella lubricantis]MBB6676628.1 nucleoside hydrolase [Cohnella lubricantis]MBP2117361.1 purine nucleosidase [Cohnella lubricantis]
MERHRIILDLEGGIDGAIALIYALLAPDIALEGVTSVRGETSAFIAAEQALRIAQLCAPGSGLRAAAGADAPAPRQGRIGPAAAGHGPTGLGGVLLPPAEGQPLRETAAEFVARLAGERPGELAYVLAGRATNWPLALRQDPALAGKLRRVVQLGGAVLVSGDATPVAEANFRADPEAADALLQTAPDLTAVGLDASAKLAIAPSRLGLIEPIVPPAQARALRLLRRLLDYRVRHPLRDGDPIGLAPLPGVAALLAATRPELFAYRVWPARVAAEGELTAGMVIADRRRRPSLPGGRPVRFAVDLDTEAALHAFLSVWVR